MDLGPGIKLQNKITQSSKKQENLRTTTRVLHTTLQYHAQNNSRAKNFAR